MDEELKILSAVDAIRCLYLARAFERKGDVEAARRWEAAAQQWMKSLGENPSEQTADDEGPSSKESA
jgi:hypothetical protein